MPRPPSAGRGPVATAPAPNTHVTSRRPYEKASTVDHRTHQEGQPADLAALRWVRHAWAACQVRSWSHRPAGERCPLCCRCTARYCGCPVHAIAQAVTV